MIIGDLITWTHVIPLPMDQDQESLCRGTESRSPKTSSSSKTKSPIDNRTVMFIEFLVPQPSEDWRDQHQGNHEDGSDNLDTHCSLIWGSACKWV